MGGERGCQPMSSTLDVALQRSVAASYGGLLDHLDPYITVRSPRHQRHVKVRRDGGSCRVRHVLDSIISVKIINNRLIPIGSTKQGEIERCSIPYGSPSFGLGPADKLNEKPFKGM